MIAEILPAELPDMGTDDRNALARSNDATRMTRRVTATTQPLVLGIAQSVRGRLYRIARCTVEYDPRL